nr:baseplate J/gp47 family protein [Brevibacterium sp. 68QC2CO]
MFEVNDVPQQVVAQLLEVYGLERDPGAQASGLVEFTFSGADPSQTVPAGTTVRWTDETTGESFDLVTQEGVTVSTVETLKGTARVLAEDVGAELNGVANQPVDVLESLPQVEAARFLGAIAGGMDPEDDESYFDRGAAMFARQTSTLVLPDQFSLAAATFPFVDRAKTYSLLDPAHPDVETLGHVTTVLSSGEAGAGVLSPEQVETVRNALTAQAVAGLVVHCVTPVVTGVTVTVEVVKDSTAVSEDVVAAVEEAVAGFMSAGSWDWRARVSKNEVLSAAAKAEGVAYVQAATVAKTGSAPADVVELTDAGYGALPHLDSVTVTVVGG